MHTTRRIRFILIAKFLLLAIRQSFSCIGIGLVFGALLYAAISGAAATPVIHIEDVDRFYRIYILAGGHPTADQLQHDYIDPGSDGLHEFAKIRNISGTTIANALEKNPNIYSDVRHCMLVLPRVRRRVEVALRKLGVLYPEARFPAVTIAVGRGKPVAVAGPTSSVMIALEALCATNYLNSNLEDRFVHVIAHEYVHVQQSHRARAIPD